MSSNENEKDTKSSLPQQQNAITAESMANDDSSELANCLLSQYRFTAAGIGLGTAYTMRYKKGFIPMVAAGALGTSADIVYGFLVECLEFRQPSASSPTQQQANQGTKE